MRLNSIVRFFLFGLLLCSVACSDFKENSYNTKAVAEEVKNRKIKHISEGQLLEWVGTKGSEAVLFLQEQDSKKLQSGIDSLQEKYQIKIRRIPFNTTEDISSYEKEVLEAYQYSAENNIAMDNNVQVLKESNEVLFNAPLYKDKKVIGIWNIVFSRKEAIKRMDVKK